MSKDVSLRIIKKLSILSVVIILSIFIITSLGIKYESFNYDTISIANVMNNKEEYKKIAWISISKRDKLYIIGGWEDADVKVSSWDKVGYKISKKDLKEVVAVVFNTTDEDKNGPIIFYVNPISKEIVGFEPRRRM